MNWFNKHKRIFNYDVPVAISVLILCVVPQDQTSESNLPASGEPSQIQSQAPHEDMMEKTDNNLAQRSISLTSDDVLLDERAVLRDSMASDDQEVLLELNTEEQEQFEVLDSADGEDDKSHDSIG